MGWKQHKVWRQALNLRRRWVRFPPSPLGVGAYSDRRAALNGETASANLVYPVRLTAIKHRSGNSFISVFTIIPN